MRSPLLSLLGSCLPMLVAGLVATLAGCGEEAQSPAAPEPALLATSSTTALTFRQMSAGHNHTCAVTLENLAYCWGFNAVGQLGDGTTSDRFLPVRVAGALQFSHVSVGMEHSCGVTLQNVAFCWGRNAEGQLGVGTLNNHLVPLAVAGGRLFRELEAGFLHTCGII